MNKIFVRILLPLLVFVVFSSMVARAAELEVPLPGVKLSAPKIRCADGQEVLLEGNPTAGKNIFHAPAGSAAAGLTVNAEWIKTDAGYDYALEMTASTTLTNIQWVQALWLELDWRSYVIAPGAMYQGNRFVVSPQPYCPFILTEGVTPYGPIVTVDVPRLTADKRYRTELAANALAIPVVGIYDPKRGSGFLVGMEIYGAWGVSGVNLTTLPGEAVGVEICLPVRRSMRYAFCNWVETNERGMSLKAGETIKTRIHLLPVASKTIPAFVTHVAEYGYATRGTEARRMKLSFAEAAKLIEGKLNQYNWSETNGYYRSTMNPAGAGLPLQSGWVGGGATFSAMAASDDALSRTRGKRMMDFICRTGLSPSGYFNGGYDGTKWRSFSVKRVGCRTYSLIRRPLECTRDVLKTMELLRQRGEAIDPVWEQAARSNLNAMVSTVARFGHLGYTVDFETGDVLWGDSACGAFGIEPLVRGTAWFNDPKYLETAKQLADYYVTRFVERGFTCGGVGDALMAVDSESNYALLAGLMKLHAATGDAKYLAWARETADLFATWVLCYDAQLPPDSPLGKLGIQARGAVFANIQNQHGAPGICTASGLALLELYQATGETRYLRMLEDIATCIPQMIVRPGQNWIWKNSPPGCLSERLMTADAMLPCGQTEAMSTWAEISMLLTISELPATFRDERRGVTANFELGR